MMDQATAQQLLDIAKEHCFAVEERGDLKARNNDVEDFLEISVWGLQAMLQAAFELGKQSH